MHTFSLYLVFAAGLAALFSQTVKYLRIAQREHYIAKFTVKFAFRWYLSSSLNISLLIFSLFFLALSFFAYLWALPAAAFIVIAPFGLTWRGKTSKLKWTRRLKTTAIGAFAPVLGATAAAFAVASFAVGDTILMLCAFFMPAFVDLALFLLGPFEKKLASKYVETARTKLKKVNPVNVAITGSYGKTSTKTYLAHMLEKNYQVLASPKSYNNKAGLARTINEGLLFSTEVFVAEMGTFGPGEIRNMCSWVVPKIAAITAVGPVHLERFRTVENISKAKAEITERAEVVVLNTDNPYLLRLAAELSESGKKIVTVSAQDENTNLCIKETTHSEGGGSAVTKNWALFSGGAHLADIDASDLGEGVVPTNLAVAVAIALELNCPMENILASLRDLPQASNRLNIETLPNGTVLLDDTYNSNPAGAEFALSKLNLLAKDGGKKILVTPGMIELGPQQKTANENFGYTAAGTATHIVFVKHTNRASFLRGVKKYQSESGKDVFVKTVADRKTAVAFVKEILGPGDVVLYENDLPDHYP